MWGFNTASANDGMTKLFLEVSPSEDDVINIAWILRDERYGEIDRGDYRVVQAAGNLSRGSNEREGFYIGSYVLERLRKLIDYHRPEIIIFIEERGGQSTETFLENHDLHGYNRRVTNINLLAEKRLKWRFNDVTDLHIALFGNPMPGKDQILRKVESIERCYYQLLNAKNPTIDRVEKIFKNTYETFTKSKNERTGKRSVGPQNHKKVNNYASENTGCFEGIGAFFDAVFQIIGFLLIAFTVIALIGAMISLLIELIG